MLTSILERLQRGQQAKEKPNVKAFMHCLRNFIPARGWI